MIVRAVPMVIFAIAERAVERYKEIGGLRQES